MSVKNGMCTKSAVMTGVREKFSKFCSFFDGLTVKNKANFDVQLKSEKSFAPICKHSFGYNKEFKLKHILLAAAALVTVAAVFSAFKKKD